MTRCGLIVIGGSWGGMEAVAELLGELPGDLGVPIIVVLHRGSQSTEALGEFLARRCALRVVEADDKTELRPGRVYLAPPGYHLLVERGSLALSTDAAVHFSRPSIDVTLESAAEAYDGRVVAVVLTGDNEDGAEGLAEVRRFGGMTIVQDPETAERPAMPQAAIARSRPDAVLPLAEIAPLLRRLASADEEALR